MYKNLFFSARVNCFLIFLGYGKVGIKAKGTAAGINEDTLLQTHYCS